MQVNLNIHSLYIINDHQYPNLTLHKKNHIMTEDIKNAYTAEHNVYNVLQKLKMLKIEN